MKHLVRILKPPFRTKCEIVGFTNVRPFFTSFLLLIFSFSSFGQRNDASVLQLADSLAQLSAKRPLESVYIQSSKEVYEKGEDLWFAGTVLNRKALNPSLASRTLYVELREEANDLVVSKEMFVLGNGFASGHFFLPDSLQPGTYWLVAFTDHSTAPGKLSKSVRKILIKDRITPYVFIKTSFDQTSFAEGEVVAGNVELTSSGGNEIANLKTVLRFEYQGKLLERIRGKTDLNGKFKFQTQLASFPPGTTLTVRVKNESVQEIYSTGVPLKKNEDISVAFMPEGGKIISGMTNHVAFKAAFPDGQPAKIKKAILLADDVAVDTFQSQHAGMGRFSFFANGQKEYRVEVIDPAVPASFQLPEFNPTGVQLHLIEKSQDQLVFGIMQSYDQNPDSVHLVVKQRGNVFWGASALLDNNGVFFYVPTRELPQGIIEVTLYNAKRTTLAERLVFVHLDRLLDISVEVNKPQFGAKEKVDLKLKVTDPSGSPVQGGFTLSVVDEIYKGPFAEKNICSHFLLSEELKGSLFEPAYYFNKDNPRADEYLDLLMLTQGWRTYEWHFGHLIDLKSIGKFRQLGSITGQIDLKSLSKYSKKRTQLEVQIISQYGAAMVYPDANGKFVIPEEILIGSSGSMIAVKVLDDDKATITFKNSFDRNPSDRSVSNLVYADKQATLSAKNWSGQAKAIDDIVELEGVEVTASRVTYGKNWGNPYGLYVPTNKDYVCKYNILNCRNHPTGGTKPIPGRAYTIGVGRTVVYKADEMDERKEINFIKGHCQIPKFYQPNYEGNPDEKYVPDFRNTLIWEPNLVTDENGEAEISFFTSDIRSIFYCSIEGMGANGQFGRQYVTLKVLD
jgi:hypothetical protein